MERKCCVLHKLEPSAVARRRKFWICMFHVVPSREQIEHLYTKYIGTSSAYST